MADSRQPEDGAPQWDPSGGQEPGGTHGANGFSSSAYRTCQPGGAHVSAAPYSARENGFNGELTGAQAITAEQVSARIVQEVTAEAVAVLKGEQETQRLPSVEDTTNLPPSPPPSPAAEHFGPVERGRKNESLPPRVCFFFLSVMFESMVSFFSSTVASGFFVFTNTLGCWCIPSQGILPYLPPLQETNPQITTCSKAVLMSVATAGTSSPFFCHSPAASSSSSHPADANWCLHCCNHFLKKERTTQFNA
uniref:Microtubule-associated protein 2 n=1 Tax=Salarias fasciatus TaxID=181472 RepID=A0A672GTF5_SALFA